MRTLLTISKIWVLVALAFAAVVACGDRSESAQPAPTPEPQIIEVPNDPGSLVVYSGRSESLVGPIIEQFGEATGIEVSTKYGGTGAIAATILEEGGNSPADVFFAQDPGGLGAVAQAGMFSALPGDVTGLVPDWAQSSAGLWVGVSGRARVLVYNTERLSEDDLPASIFDLTDPKWKGRLGLGPDERFVPGHGDCHESPVG